MSRARHRDERGAVAVIAAISMTMILGVAALVIDLGNARAQRRVMVTATDAAALAAAKAFARGVSVSTACNSAFSANKVTAAEHGPCTTTGTNVEGTVKATATRSIDYSLAPVFANGNDTGTVSSMTTVHVGTPTRVDGLVPFALCVDDMIGNNDVGTRKKVFRGVFDSDVAAKFGDAPLGAFDEPALRWSQHEDDDCTAGANPDGPWTILDFGGNPLQWATDGYSGTLGGTLPRMIGTRDMAHPPVSNQLAAMGQALVNRTTQGLQTIVPLYDRTSNWGNNAAPGLATQVEVVGFAAAQFDTVNIDNPTDAGSDDVVRVRLSPRLMVKGDCCDPASIFTGNSAVDFDGFRMLRICAVDHAVGTDCSQ